MQQHQPVSSTKIFFLLIALVMALLIPQIAQAYTFFIDRNPKRELSTAHWPLKRIPLLFSVDQEKTTWEHKTASQLTKEAAMLWKQIDGSRMKMQVQTLPFDINEKNFLQKVVLGDQQHEIIFDQQGKILESLGLDPAFVAGISVPITKENPKGDPKGKIDGEIIDSFTLINTRYASDANKTLRLLVHEIGHSLGLGHTNIAHLQQVDRLPVMFFDPIQQNGAVLLHADDKAGLASLYPADHFETKYGAISGMIRDKTTAPAFGLAVIATSVFTGPIGTWSQQDGRFLLTGLPPGKYSLFVRAIDGSKSVKGMLPASHVGGIYKKAMLSFCPEFFNDQVFVNCRFKSPAPQTLEIKAGQTIKDVEIAEFEGNPSNNEKCIWGAAPQLFGVRNKLPPLPFGKAGTPCPQKPKPEPQKEEPPPTQQNEPMSRIIFDASESFDTGNPRVYNRPSPQTPTCGCKATSPLLPIEWSLFLFCFFLCWRKKTKKI